MRFSTVLFTLAAALTQALPTTNHQKELPPYFILTGDSTTAVNGGWGDGFLRFLQNTTGGVNIGKSGATTVSFRSGGYWAKAIQAVKDQKCNYRPIVTIQFGHNDQKAEANITLTQFQANMEQLAREVISAGGTPIILTSLTRRTFSGGKVIENLAEHSQAAIDAAEAVGIQYQGLNRASTDYINAIGSANADKYNLSPTDRTHLNVSGETVFGRMVADLILRGRPDLAAYFIKRKALSDKIWSGEYATGDE
ncbi:unnamed protein product [Clonostachys rhizophaga]|uniref:SGNH hydrolase-type esterase domain-containing protein n=1 Tax=Clonostachys rhizophaga TaxID=160324 RepID=A0A9N9VCA0_9HYPO|nr:unnamed protein product [Clonostachys rhizophaga]